MKKRQVSAWLAVLIAISAAGASSLIVYRLATNRRLVSISPTPEEENQRLEQLVAERDRQLKDLQEQLADMQRQLAGVESAEKRKGDGSEATDARLEQVRMLGQARDQLQAARKLLADTQQKAAGLEATVEQLQQENGKLTGDLADARDKIASTGRVASALQDELKASTDRITQLTLDSQNSRQESKAATEKLGQYRDIFSQMEEIERRRDVYLTNLTRRYKDLNSELRSLSARVEAARDNPRQGIPDTSRIQDLIQSADDDLQQLTNLDARADRLRAQFRKP
jgi:chromosome segregation ATPase